MGIVQCTVLQKKDLTSYDMEEFIDFITKKTHNNTFEIKNIV